MVAKLMILLRVKKLNIRYLFCWALFIAPYSLADAVNTEILFSDSYEGFLYSDTDWYWSEVGAQRVASYKTPEIEFVSDDVQLNPICIEGGGGDCLLGVLYKKFSQDANGNKFYLVKDQTQNDVWIKVNDRKSKNFDESMVNNSGMELILSDVFEATDTSISDGVPDLEPERNKQLKKILHNFSPQLGVVTLTVPGDTKVLKVKDSHLTPDSQFLNYPLSKDSYYYQKENNNYLINTTMFKRQGNYMVVELHSIPGLIVRDYECAGLDSNYVWLDTKGMEIESIKADVHYPPIEFLLGEFGRSYSVKEIKVFNGNSYALIQEHLSVLNPFVAPDEDRVKREGYTVPYKWIKIRDDKGRLRFWFSSYSC